MDKAIDPGRMTIGKGLLGHTGGYGCERQGYYEERVRLPNGWRVRRVMPERVHFGKAVDVAHALFMRRRIEGAELGDLQAAAPGVLEMAYYAGLAEQPWADDAGNEYTPTDEDKSVFMLQLDNALRLLVGLAENRLPKDQPVPTEPVPVLQVPTQGAHVQGLDGQTLEVPGVFGERALGTTPDYVYTTDEGGLAGWLDVKAVDRAYSYPAQWTKAEAVLYTYALLRLNGGEMPQWAGYHEYRRNAKPYWMLTTTVPDPAWAGLAEWYVRRWQRALEIDDPNALQFSPKSCAKCAFRQPIPEAGFPGCPVGEVVLRMAPEEDNAAAG